MPIGLAGPPLVRSPLILPVTLQEAGMFSNETCPRCCSPEAVNGVVRPAFVREGTAVDVPVSTTRDLSPAQ